MSSFSGVFYESDPVKNVFERMNYDGQTDIIATSIKTFGQGVVAVGRAKAWVSYAITGGVDFMQNIASQVGE